MSAEPEVVSLYTRAVDAFLAAVDQVPDGAWAAPTPCPDWDVRALVNHVVGEDRWVVPLLEGRTIAEVGDALDGDLLGAAPPESATTAGKAASAAFAEPGATERTVHLSFGDTPAEEYVRQLAADHLIHAWDLAVATGADPTMDEAAVRACADWFAGREHLYRQSGAIGPAAEVPPTASEQDRLLAAFGRNPAWTP